MADPERLRAGHAWQPPRRGYNDKTATNRPRPPAPYRRSVGPYSPLINGSKTKPTITAWPPKGGRADDSTGKVLGANSIG